MVSAQQKIAGLLEQLIGLKVSSIGSSTMNRVLSIRMKTVGIDNVEKYFDKLTGSRLELRKLVEDVVIPETWFFRDQEPFRYLTEYVLQAEKKLSGGVLRILSLPCSTGEEPYSIAMTMLQAGLTPASFYIDAVDVSERALALAREGLYGENSFRVKDLSFRDSYFVSTEEGYALKQVVHDKVRFIQGNLLQTGFVETLGCYDVVFCRNVL
ncbi:MAG: chemotaxis protein CheR, partial [Candidatus Marinimicrobia bacterium]|nr:chemotaxis protein CheR [Candidatus Neomarinimicrobiota bacterium]